MKNGVKKVQNGNQFSQNAKSSWIFSLTFLGSLLFLNASLLRASSQDEEMRPVPISVEYFYDDSENLKIEDMRSESITWQTAGKGQVNLGLVPGSLWAKIKLGNQINPGETYLLQFGIPGADYLDVYFYSEGQLLSWQQAGDHRPHKQWSQPWYRIPTFEVPKAERLEVYLRLDGTQKSLPLQIWAMTDFVHQIAQQELPILVYFGALTALLLYNSIMAIATRITAYFTYCLTLLGILLFQSHVTGFGGFLLWPLSAKLSDFARTIGMLLSYCSSIIFAIQLLNLSLPRYLLRSVLVYIVAIFSFYFGFLLLGSEKYIERIGFLLSFPAWMLSILFCTFIGYRQRSQMLRWFLVAWSSLLAGSAVFMLMVFGLLPRNLFTSSALLIGSAVEFILLSLALGMRINYLQNQARAEQEERIKAEVQHAEILGLESQHRKRQASSFAHYINNPLNQLVLNRDLLKQSSSHVQSLVQSLLPEDSEDYEVKSIKQRFQSLFSDVDLSLTEVDSAVSRISHSIAEVRSVSGIDGAKIQEVKVSYFISILKTQLAGMLGAEDFQRIEFGLEQLPNDFSLMTDFFLIKNALEQFFLSLVLKLEERLVISFSEGLHSSLVMKETLGIVGTGEVESFTDALFVSLQNNLVSAGVDAALEKDGQFFSITLRSKNLG